MKRSHTPLWSGLAFVATLLLLAGAATASTITVPNGASGGTCGASNPNRYEFGGSCGSLVNITDTNPAYVQDNSPAAEGTYRVRFYANFGGKSSVAPPANAPAVSLSMASGNAFDFFVAYDGADPAPPAAGGNAVIRVELGQSSATTRTIKFAARLNNGTEATFSRSLIGKALRGWRAIEINWAKASTPSGSNGVLQAWIDGVQVGNLTNLANGNQVVNMVRWGAVAGIDSGTSGTFKLDDFVSQRSGYIGPALPFSDVAQSSPFFPEIQSIHHAEIIPPVSPGTFNPTGMITRKEMAKYLLTASENTGYTPPACTTPTFNDVPCSHPYAAWIYELVRRDITAGCSSSPPNYCPDNPVTRQQMVVFIQRTNLVPEPPACGGGNPSGFADVPNASTFCPWINKAISTGLTVGCATGPPALFCPGDNVGRQAMATFIRKEFALPFIAVGP